MALTDVCVCVSEAGGVLPAAAADEEQTFQPRRARHDLHLHRHLEYGLDTRTHIIFKVFRFVFLFNKTYINSNTCWHLYFCWEFWSLSAGSVPSPKSVASWVLCRGLGKTLDEMTVTIPHDLYVFGSQENSVCEREWVESLRAMLKEQTELDYKPVRNKDFSK